MFAVSKVITTVGCDPELFFQREGKIIGSERVIAQSTPKWDPNGGDFAPTRVVVDGVQAELNPQYSYNVLGLQGNIRGAFQLLKGQLDQAPGVSICWRSVVPIAKRELDALSDKARMFGCQPSDNFYGHRPIRVNSAKYFKRSAGGHLHFGVRHPRLLSGGYSGLGVDLRRDFVAPLDVLCGNTSVLIDREPLAAERRRNYGRAGEYRLTTFGLEYRTLSNFWLRHSALHDLMCGLAQFAANIYVNDESLRLYTEAVNGRGIYTFRRAINKNDFDLALGNLLALRPLFEKWGDTQHEWDPPEQLFPIGASNFDKFLQFVERCRTTPLEEIFPTDPLDHWLNGTFISFRKWLEAM